MHGDEQVSAGTFRPSFFEVIQDGIADFALDAPAWIDVIADGGAMNTSGHQGASGCAGPRKIVEFDFSVSRRVTLQLSGADSPAVRITVTPSR